MRFNISRLLPLAIVESNIVGRNLKAISNNYFGRTTGRAFSAVGYALQNPKKTKCYSFKSESEALITFEVLESLLKTNSMQYFEIKLNNRTFSVKYNPYYSNDDYLEVRRLAISKSNNAT